MKRLLFAVVIAFLFALPALGRQWSSRDGSFSVEAELLDVKDGNVILKKQDGSHVTVPLSKLSLADVRYVQETLKAAEAAITGGKPPAPSAEKPPLAGSASKAAAPAVPVKLQYQWKKGQTYVYRVKIVGELGDAREELAGNVTYKVKSVLDDEIELGMTSALVRGETITPARILIIPSRHVRFFATVPSSNPVTISVDPLGRVQRIEGTAQLPYLLGDLSQLMIEQLAPEKKSSWTVAGDTGISVIQTLYPYCRYSPIGFHEGVPANEKTVYTVQGQDGKLVKLAKHYELTTAASVGGKPRFEAVGDGKLTFDTERNVPASLDFHVRVTVRDANKTEEIPLRVTYRLLSDAEIAQAAKEAEKAKREAEKARQERLRPLNDKELEGVLADLASNDPERIRKGVNLLANKKPQRPNAKIAKALEPIMLDGESIHLRSEAARAIVAWATAENVPALIKALSDQWPPIASSAVEALGRLKSKDAVKPVAALLANMQTRHAAIKYLKAIGPDAEDAVLPFLDGKDQWLRAKICELLATIGTKKSLPALEKAAKDSSWMVNRAAAKAITAIKARQ